MYKVLVHGRTGTSEHVLSEGTELVVGRDPECRVALSDGRVSRRHAVVRLRGGAIELEDLGSRNGSLLDGERVAPNAPVVLRPTSVVRIGGAVLVFERAPESPTGPWTFDRASFERAAASALAPASSGRAAPTGLVEIRWELGGGSRSTTTLGDGRPPAGLQQVLARIARSRGVIGALDGGRILVLLPDTLREKVDESAALVQRICDTHGMAARVSVAFCESARTLDALLAELGRGESAERRAVVPPVVFQGGLRSVDALLAKLDASEAPVLIVGETGVGKDVLARTLHARSRRASRPFVALNCAAFTEALFESELFGHERGAFTGAAQAKAGLLESAAGGTVFLDEIGEMPLGMQAKLLRVVENREVLRVGALSPRQIDVRFLFATNRDLRREIELKTFRSDLFFRIGSISLAIPPLRERLDDIAPLMMHFVETASRRIGRPVPRVLPETVRFLEGHAWPGNVRELKNVMELAVLVQDGDEIRPADIHIERYMAAEASPSSGAASARDPESVTSEPKSASAPRSASEPKTEKERIVDALERSAWNQSTAAKLLGMPRRTLVKRLAQYELPRPRKRLP
ncbi:MAG: sigma 54-interacting transcriptional regulator [Labilithrix sp.]|nr:sigma 54-interacting transcriptional regulator [Labilithrix sp.]